ncbi:hypothetical protein SLS58_004661 [Diplodia intermedia]|uniref:Uncharacterized protein n=1 Tax=Diplodia intermedia TaxID=856260 RepID=A0ABR3TSM0_9PEZI
MAPNMAMELTRDDERTLPRKRRADGQPQSTEDNTISRRDSHGHQDGPKPKKLRLSLRDADENKLHAEEDGLYIKELEISGYEKKQRQEEAEVERMEQELNNKKARIKKYKDAMADAKKEIPGKKAAIRLLKSQISDVDGVQNAVEELGVSEEAMLRWAEYMLKEHGR